MTRLEKKRWRRAGSVVLVLAVLVLAFIGRELYLAYTAERGSAIDYAAELQALDLKRQGVAESDPNGWGPMQAAMRAVRQAENDVQATLQSEPTRDEETGEWVHPPHADFVLLWEALSRETPIDPEVPELAPTLAALALLEERGVPEQIERALAFERITPPKVLVRPIVLAPAEGYEGLRQTASVLAWHARQAVIEDRPDDLARSATTLLRLGSAYARAGRPLQHMLGVGIFGFLTGTVRQAVVSGDLDEAECEALLNALESEYRAGELTDVVAAQRLEIMDALQWCYSPGGRRVFYHPDDAALFTSTSGGWLSNCKSLFLPRLDRDVAMAERFFADWEALANLPTAEFSQSTINPYAEFDAAKWPAGMFEILLPPINRIRDAHVRMDVEQRGARVMLLLELHRLQHGEYPVTLEELAPNLAARVPEDPVRGGPFLYRRLDAPDEHGRRYLLYSTGTDLEDNGGHEPAAEQRHWPIQHSPGGRIQAAGADYIVNHPPEKSHGEP